MTRDNSSDLKTTIAGFLDHLIVDAGLSRLTIESYGSDLKGFSNFSPAKASQTPHV